MDESSCSFTVEGKEVSKKPRVCCEGSRTHLGYGGTQEIHRKTLHRKRASFLLLFLLPVGFLSFFLSFILSFYSIEIEPRALCRLGKHSPKILLLF